MFKIANITKQIFRSARNIGKYSSQSKGCVNAADEFAFESFKVIPPQQAVTKDQFKVTTPIVQAPIFQKVPKAIWDAVGNMSKVSSRTSATIYSLSQKGDHVISILINLADEIKKGIGCTKLENLVNQILLNDDSDVLQDNIITLPSGANIGIWKNNTLKLYKDVNVDKEHFVKYIIKYFAKESKNK